jgi:methyltransferase (TIGR00027 family)
MEPGQPSRTAFAAAAHRATHQVVDMPVVLADPLAARILGLPDDPALQPSRQRAAELAAEGATMRALIVARSLLAEQTLEAAVAGGASQYVLLGAGLDTFAYRSPFPALRVFEVDYPSTGQWKRARLAAAGILIPDSVTYAAIDFERETLSEALARTAFDFSRPAIFAWLGVTPYLTREAIAATLAAVASLPAGTQIVFDYGEPRDDLPETAQAFMRERMARLAAIGEPWISFFTPADMAALLTASGFSEIEDLDGAKINARWYAGRADGLQAYPRAHVARAKV